MSILDKLTQEGSALSKNNGSTPKTPDFSTSKLHNTYSINGDPSLADKPSPSKLDPIKITKYMDNLPR